MNIQKFRTLFEAFFPPNELARVSPHLEDRFSRSFFDPCFLIDGMISVKKQKLLNIAFACVDPGECYVEVGTYTGKSLISAMLNNDPRRVYACDNFSEFQDTNSHAVLTANLERYGVSEGVTFYNGDFNEQIHAANIPEPIGVYFFDGPHDEKSQYSGIRVAEDLLADEVLVIVDDWRLAADSTSYAKAGTERAVRDSENSWDRLYELPARFNGDHALWWNGVGVYSFRRTAHPGVPESTRVSELVGERNGR